MLTREEQEAVLKKAQAMRANHVIRLRMVEKSEMAPKVFHELRQQDDEDMRDLLKEVG